MSAEPNRARGASSSNTGYGDIIRAWRSHHAFSAKSALKRLLATPLQTLMTALVVAIALALPATLLLALDNVERLGERWDANPKLNVFLHLRAQPAAIEQLQTQIRALPQVASLDYISPKDALAQFEQQSGFSDVIKGLEENPLPPTLVVTPKQFTPEVLELLAAKIRTLAVVDSVDLDMAWVKRLQALMQLGEKVVLALASLLGFGVLLAIGNTVRLAIESRKEEILVTKLVGGTNSFVRRPFLYSGVWYGLFGGVLACLLVSVGFASLKSSVARLAHSYNSQFDLTSLGLDGVVILLLTSMALGLLGAWLAVGRHLHAIEPR